MFELYDISNLRVARTSGKLRQTLSPKQLL